MEPADLPTETCAVCWVAPKDERVEMPCCGAAESTTWYCRRCIEIICETAVDGVGVCPIGCGPIVITDGVVAKAPYRTGQCRMCMQQRTLVKPNLCAACVIGEATPLTYECDRCHRRQRIPHPMWRYQAEGPGAFGTATWACHVGCGDYTHWRVVPEDVARVPPMDAPASWGGQEGWLAAVRERRLAELRGDGRAAAEEGPVEVAAAADADEVPRRAECAVQ